VASFSALNYLNVGSHGRFARSGNFETLPVDIDAIFEELRQDSSHKLALYFHGGLIDESSGREIARKLAPLYQAATVIPSRSSGKQASSKRSRSR
jgi:hypothetical protein